MRRLQDSMPRGADPVQRQCNRGNACPDCYEDTASACCRLRAAAHRRRAARLAGV